MLKKQILSLKTDYNTCLEEELFRQSHTAGNSICSHTVLHNGLYVTGTYSDNKTEKSEICLWNVYNPNQPLVRKFTTKGDVHDILELNNGWIVTAHEFVHFKTIHCFNISYGMLCFWDFTAYPGQELIGYHQFDNEYYPSHLVQTTDNQLLFSAYYSKTDQLGKLIYTLNKLDFSTDVNNFSCEPSLITLTGNTEKLMKLSNGYIVSCNNAGTMKIWDMKNNSDSPIKTVNTHTYIPKFIEVGPTKIATLSFSKREIKVWDWSKPEGQECCYQYKMEVLQSNTSNIYFNKLSTGQTIAIIKDWTQAKVNLFDFSDSAIARNQCHLQLAQYNISLPFTNSCELINDGEVMVGAIGSSIVATKFKTRTPMNILLEEKKPENSMKLTV